VLKRSTREDGRQPLVDGRDRVRTCVVRFFLEDGTVDVCEPKAGKEVVLLVWCF
jgi:hypothetical protein